MRNWRRFAPARGNSLTGYSRKMRRSWLVLPLVASLVWVSPTARADLSTPEIDRAFTRMYNTDFRGAHESIDRYVSAQPADPLGYAVRASAYLFSELDRLGILESEFFGNDKHIGAKKALRPDADVRTKFFAAVEDAQSRGTKLLAARANDQNALFAMAITQGVLMDYTAL